jgi:glutamine cyclotransferase
VSRGRRSAGAASRRHPRGPRRSQRLADREQLTAEQTRTASPASPRRRAGGIRRRPWLATGLLVGAAAGSLVAALLARSAGLQPARVGAAPAPLSPGERAASPLREAAGGTGRAPAAAAAPAAAEHLRVKVLSVRQHDPTSYTQGLVWDHGRLYESAGLYGRSSLRQVDPRTGEVLRRLDLAPGYFAEGLAQVDNWLVQLTWKEGVAFVYDALSFGRVGEFHYDGEGWGLCDDGRRLVMSDGSDRLSFRDRRTFALLGGVDVRLEGRPLQQLNELECVGGAVYANVWMTDEIVRIDPAGGRVTAVIDAGGLLDPAARAHADVLNGIAYDPAKKTFLITGKLWPKMFEVVFVPARGESRQAVSGDRRLDLQHAPPG